jgi:hypothetical protein
VGKIVHAPNFLWSLFDGKMMGTYGKTLGFGATCSNFGGGDGHVVYLIYLMAYPTQ